MFTAGQVVRFGADWRPLVEAPVFRSFVRAALAVHQNGIISGVYGPYVLGTLSEIFFININPALVQTGVDDYSYQGLSASQRLTGHADLSAFNNGTVEVFGLTGMWALGATLERMSVAGELLTLDLFQAHTINEDGRSTEEHEQHSQRVVSLEDGFASVGERLFIFSALTQECYIIRKRVEGHQALYPFNEGSLPVLYGFGLTSSQP